MAASAALAFTRCYDFAEKSMGLDVYVGSLVRYYTGDWETIVQQLGRETGVQVVVQRPPLPKPTLLDRLRAFFSPQGADAAARDIERWRRRLEHEIRAPITWNEDPDAVYFTDKPVWDCYGALVLWAAYDEQPQPNRPATAEGWSEDATYKAVSVDLKSRYRHLVSNTQLWLPVDFADPIGTYGVTGDAITVGSSVQLMRELEELNRRTWSAGDAQISQWRLDGAEYGAPLEVSAHFAYAIFYELARESVRRRLPMKLDY